MKKINLNYISNRIKYGIGASLMTLSLVSCSPSSNVGDNSHRVVDTSLSNTVKISVGYSIQKKKVIYTEEALKKIKSEAGRNKIVIEVYDEIASIVGIELLVKDLNGKVIDNNVVTANDGYVLSGIKPGETYVIEERMVPENYILENNYEFTVPVVDEEKFPNNEYYIINRLNIYKQSKDLEFYKRDDEQIGSGSFTIDVVNDGENRLCGMIFEVSNENGKVIERFVCKDETYVVSNLSDGKYKVKIVDEIPEGYELLMISGICDNNKESNECEVVIKDGKYFNDNYSGLVFYFTKLKENTKEESKMLKKTKKISNN